MGPTCCCILARSSGDMRRICSCASRSISGSIIAAGEIEIGAGARGFGDLAGSSPAASLLSSAPLFFFSLLSRRVLSGIVDWLGWLGILIPYLLSAREEEYETELKPQASDSEGPPRKASRAGLGSGSDGRTRQCYRQWALYDVVDWVVGPPSRLGVWTRWVVVSLLFLLGRPIFSRPKRASWYSF